MENGEGKMMMTAAQVGLTSLGAKRGLNRVNSEYNSIRVELNEYLKLVNALLTHLYS